LKAEIPVVAVVLKNPIDPADEEISIFKKREILQYYSRLSSPHKAIHRIEFVSLIPRNSQGKILRRLLTEKFSNGILEFLSFNHSSSIVTLSIDN
jgi:acyl-coenzyme A synthetase/AMP-(fatty) acid ligase